MTSTSDADKLFKRLDVELFENIEDHYFQEPREFRSLIQVLKVLNDRVEQINSSSDSAGDLQSVLKEHNPGQLHLQQQLDIVNKVIEEVVTFQHGGLNHSVDTMGEVVKEYTSGRTDIQALRKALAETQSVLTAKKDKKASLRELWLRKVELQESLRMVRDLEELKNTPLKVQRLMQQKKYYTTVQCLTCAVSKMFGEDLVAVGALTIVREKIMDLKEVLLESCVSELKEVVIGSVPELMAKDDEDDSESDDQLSDSRSDSAMSYLHDDRSSVSFRPSVTSQASPSLVNPGADLFSFYQLAEPAGNSNGASSNAWSLDLKDVDESAEAALLDPSSSGPLFIRLLVKTIHVLQCEDDVERMILESLYQSFIDTVLLRFKEVAQSRLSSILERKGDFSSDEEELELHGKLFARYAGGLLDALLGLQQRLLYVCRLLAVSKDLRTNSNSRATTAKESTRKLVLELWHDLEDVIIRELRIHFLEMDVEQISDRPTSVLPLDNARNSGATSSSLRSRAKDSHRRRTTMDGAEGLDEDEDRRMFESRLVFRPSAKHAARLFKKVVSYSVKYQRILKDNALDESAPLPSTLGALGAAPSGVVGLGGQNKVLTTVQLFLESELIPVIQSAANETMRDLQLNTDLFQPSSGHTESWQAGNTASEMAWPLCEGLCRYWVQLFQHRAMVTVVLDRLLRGFAMATREARDCIAFSFISAEGGLNKEVCKYMRADVLYNAYRQRVFTGKRSLEDAIHGSSDSQATHATTPDGIQGAQDDHALLQAYSREITGLWGTTYWDLTSTQHPASAQKVLKAPSSLVSLSCLSYSADWLVRKMIALCNYTTRQGAGVLLQGILLAPVATAGSTGGASPMSPRTSVAFNKSLRAELYESKHQLASAVLEALRDVTRCSDETLAMLRAETQLLCFYFMAKLAATPFLPASGHSAPSSADSATGRTGGLEEELLATFVQQLTAYIQAIQVSLSPFALPIVLGPVAALVPRLLTRAIMAQYGHYSAAAAQSMSAAWKTRLLRLVVSAQQQLSLTLQGGLAIHAELAEPRRYILDVLTLGFEALRKLISAIEISSVELRNFLYKNIGEYTQNEIKFLFSRASDRSVEWTLEDALKMYDQAMKDRATKSTVSTVARA